MMKNIRSIDDRCGTLNNMTALSVASSSTVGVLMLLTIPLNSVIIYSLIKERRRKYKSLFYKLLLNIAIADILTGLSSDPFGVISLIKEALKINIKSYEMYILHVSVFFTDSVALLTLTVLSIERIVALLFPIKHRKGMKKKTENILLLSVWPLGMLLVLPYFYVNFIRQLLVFSSVNICVTVISLFITTLAYRQKLGRKKTNCRERQTKVIEIGSKSPTHSRKTETSSKQLSKDLQQPPLSKLEEAEKNTPKGKAPSSQQKATRTFIVLLCVFAITYLPTTVTMLYMNVCTDCNCVVVHVMRDVSVLFILSSSVLRPLNFILTLKHLRGSVVRIFKKDTRSKQSP